MAAKKTTKKSATTKAKAQKTTKSMPTDNDDNVTLLTQEGYDQLIEELEQLKNVRRREVAERIKEAISYGDLSENSEYEEAKNEQAFVEGRILELEEKVKHAKIIKSHKATVVQLGAIVTVKDVKKSDSVTYKIVGSTEADPLSGKISNESPVGKALLEQKVGDEVEVVIPKGTVTYKIEKLEY